MPQPVKLSDPLVDAARDAAELAHRSLAAQIEHWATLGRAIEGRLNADQAATLAHSVREPSTPYRSRPEHLNAAVATALSTALSPRTQRAFADELLGSPGPTFSADPALPGCIVRENPDGSRTPGRWVSNRFVPLKASAARKRRKQSG